MSDGSMEELVMEAKGRKRSVESSGVGGDRDGRTSRGDLGQ